MKSSLIIEQLFLTHAGILGVISLILLIIGNSLGTYWIRRKRFGRQNRKIHGYFSLAAYMLVVAQIGLSVIAYVDLQGRFSGLGAVLHWVHVFVSVVFFVMFTRVLIQGYRGVMKCRDGWRVLLLSAVSIIAGYVVRNVAFGEIFYPFL